MNSPGWLQFIGDRNVHSAEDAVGYIQRITNTPQLIYWVATLKEGNIPAGIISFMKRNYLDHFDIGFAFLPEFNGLGLAREAATAVLETAAGFPEYARVLATTVPGNTRSVALLERLGFRFEKEIANNGEKLFVFAKETTGS